MMLSTPLLLHNSRILHENFSFAAKLPDFMALLTIGSVAFDSIQTPYGRADKVIGGAATYIAWAASFLTERVNLVSIIGDDFPEHEIVAMQQRGIDTTGLNRIPGRKSFFWEGKYHADMNTRDTLVTDLNVLADFNPELPDDYRDSEFLMLGNLTPDIQSTVIRQMRKRPELIAMDTMNFWMNTAWDSLMDTIAQVDVLLINDEEARQMTNEHSLSKAATKILGLGPKYLVIKKGEHGALLFKEDDMFFAAGLPLQEVVDPTGAGDCFAGGFMGYLANTRDISFNSMKNAVIYGSALASFCVEAFSLDRLKTLKLQEIRERVMKFKHLTYFEVDALAHLEE